MNMNRRKWLATVSTFVASLTLSASAFAINPGSSNPASQYASSGSFNVTQTSGGIGCTIYRPTSGSGHPVILWGNGTGSSPSTYASGLRHWASWGFVVAAANTSNAGTGTAMLSCLNWVTSNLSSTADVSRVGTSGHSQGGGGSIMAGRDSRVDTTVPIQPYVLGLGHQSSSQTQQNGPMLLLGGSSDSLAGPTLNQVPVFNRTNVPVALAIRSGASHFEPVGDFGDFRGISTAWFLWQLRGNTSAGALFTGTNCGFCNASGWDYRRRGL